MVFEATRSTRRFEIMPNSQNNSRAPWHNQVRTKWMYFQFVCMHVQILRSYIAWGSIDTRRGNWVICACIVECSMSYHNAPFCGAVWI